MAISEKKHSAPIKRHESLRPLSREHHHTLLLCWKIRTGFAKGAEASRIKKYADWFYENHVLPHFEMEERVMFPILGSRHEMIKRALSEHRRLKRLFEDNSEIEKSLSKIEEELAAHVRFEERVLFNEIQKKASPEQLKFIEENHADEHFVDNSNDEFWKS